MYSKRDHHSRILVPQNTFIFVSFIVNTINFEKEIYNPSMPAALPGSSSQSVCIPKIYTHICVYICFDLGVERQSDSIIWTRDRHIFTFAESEPKQTTRKRGIGGAAIESTGITTVGPKCQQLSLKWANSVHIWRVHWRTPQLEHIIIWM